MPRTRAAVKTNPYQVHIESLRRKQQELLDSYERDKAAGNQQPDDGIHTYGTCTNCGNVIGDKRLLAVPWTPFCIDCQELQEKGLLG